MLKLTVTQPGQKSHVFYVDSDEAVIGRTPNCDVTVPDAHVSKRHAKVFAGVVLVDLGSANGTSIHGEPIAEAVLLGGRPFQLGSEASDVSIEVEHEAEEAGESPRVKSAREDLDAERQRSAGLRAELSELRARSEHAVTDPESLPLVRELRRNAEDLKRRLDALRREVESRDVAGSEALQARLASEALAKVQQQNDELRAQVVALQSSASGPSQEAARKALAERVGELEADRAEDTETIRRLRSELEAAQAQPAAGGSELFFKLQAENHSLRTQLTEAQQAPAGGSSELFAALQLENQSQKARIAALEARGPDVAAAPPADSEELEELRATVLALRMSKADLATEIEGLRAKLESSSARPVLAQTGSGQTGSAQTGPEQTGVASGADTRVAALLKILADDDVDERPPLMDGRAEIFLAQELFRFLRQVERVVTRVAGGFMNLFEQRTVLPDTAGSVRGLLSEVLVDADNPAPREEFVAYVSELGKWLVVTVGANRRAAERFAEQLKSDLSERGLTADDPIAGYKKLTGGQHAELWSRASEYLKRLTSDVIEERLENLSSTCAEELRREQDR